MRFQVSWKSFLPSCVHLVGATTERSVSLRLCVSVLLVHTTATLANDHPNIILMMADDMGMGDTSAYQDFTGNSDHDQLHTPAMEKLARMGVRFTDAHTPASRCSPTRYGLLTGRYPWRNRLKHWVLFGAQGDPVIEADRPTLGTLLRAAGYHTGLVGKWHVGLRYRQSNGLPAAGFRDADLRMPLADTPLDHGFDFCRFTSRSHGTSGPQPGKRNKPNQNIGPGHIDGRMAVGATGNGRQLVDSGSHAYVHSKLGGRHFDDAMDFLTAHVQSEQAGSRPFFLYYPSNSNHGPHTPDNVVADMPVVGAARTVAGDATTTRNDYIYENDVALGGFLKWLESTDDPRDAGHKLIDNTLVIFTSDNGAESQSKIATGPLRSNKGSCFEGGHRVPFMAAWPAGNIGDGNDQSPGRTSTQLICLTDIYATFADVIGTHLPRNSEGEKGAEDSVSFLKSLQSDLITHRPMFFHDHKEAKPDPAVAVLRLDSPLVNDRMWEGQWKIFFDAQLLRSGIARPTNVYDLATDIREQHNRINDRELQPLIAHLTEVAVKHRTAGGHRLAAACSNQRITYTWNDDHQDSSDPALKRINLAERFSTGNSTKETVEASGLRMTIESEHFRPRSAPGPFAINKRGLGIRGGAFDQVEGGEALVISFDHDVIVESAAIIAGNGVCGGHYHVGDKAPLAIYCVDGDIDAKDQSGILSDIGVLKAGETLRLDSNPHYAVESPGRWRLQALTVRRLHDQ